MRAARFEVVRSDAGWFARFRAANGRIVWVTESYTRRRAAVIAIEIVTDRVVNEWPDRAEVYGGPEVRTVDERTGATR